MKKSHNSIPQPPQFNLQQTISNLHNHFSNFRNNFSSFIHFPKPDPVSQLQPTLTDFQETVSSKPLWARISARNDTPGRAGGAAMSTEAIEERLAGVPVYALSNSAQEFVLISGSSAMSLGLFCFKEEDANVLLDQMKAMDPGMRSGSKVVPVALNKVFQLKIDGVAFRLIPDSSQIKNALMERQKAGLSDESFSGIPVFQSKSLILRSENKRYRPVFFRKEDLDKSLARASQKRPLMSGFKEGDTEVAVLENIIHEMKDSSSANWDDVVFIPPGFDVSTDASQQYFA